MSHLGHHHRQPPQYVLGHVHHLLLLKSETATQLQVHSCQDFHAKVPICMLLRLTIPSQK